MAGGENFERDAASGIDDAPDLAFALEEIDAAGQAIDFLTESRDFHIRFSTSGPRRVAEHTHDTIQISIPLGSTIASADWRAADGALKHALARRGHAMIIPAQQRHAIAWKNRARFVNIHLAANTTSDERQGFLRRIARLGEAHVIADPFLTRLGEIIVLQAARNNGLDEAALLGFRAIIETHVMHPYGASSAEVGLAPSLTASGDPGKGLPLSALKKITAAIKSDLTRPWTVDEIAGTLGLSVGHFSRSFRRSTGASPRQWLIRQRVDAAMDRLLETREPICEIAIACGFAEQAHFTRTFTRMVGTSPAAWRRRHQA